MDITLRNVCRICMNEKLQMSNLANCNIISECGTEIPLLEVLRNFTELNIESKIYPTLICSECVSLAEVAYNFKEKLERTNSILKEYLDTEDFRKLENNVTERRIEKNKKSHITSRALHELPKRCVDDGRIQEFEGEFVFSNVNCFETTTSDRTCDLFTDSNIKLEADNMEHKFKNKYSTKNEPDVKKVDKTVYSCTECNKIFVNKYIFNAHKKRHACKGQYLCNICGKGFNSQSCLRRHVKVHSGEKKYECDICFKKLKSSHNLKLHCRTHSGSKPYLCTVCGKSFAHHTSVREKVCSSE